MVRTRVARLTSGTASLVHWLDAGVERRSLVHSVTAPGGKLVLVAHLAGDFDESAAVGLAESLRSTAGGT